MAKKNKQNEIKYRLKLYNYIYNSNNDFNKIYQSFRNNFKKKNFQSNNFNNFKLTINQSKKFEINNSLQSMKTKKTSYGTNRRE